MASILLSDCVQDLQIKGEAFLKMVKEAGFFIRITCTKRTTAEQYALYCQGRQNLVLVNEVRKRAGMGPITAEANKLKVTWTLHSKHVCEVNKPLSRAFDIVLLMSTGLPGQLKYVADYSDEKEYIKIAQIGKSCGLVPGAFFKTPDYCHFEIKGDD